MTKVKDLVKEIDKGALCLPEMQRGYVWRNAKVCNLLDSLYRDYPSGTILTWHPNKEPDTRAFAISREDYRRKDFQLLLDGQQRLTSLYAVILGKPVQANGRERKIDIMFNLEHPNKPNEDDGVDAGEKEIQAQTDNATFMVRNKKIENNKHWVSVTEVFKTKDNTKFLMQVGITDLKNPRFNKYNQRLNNLRKIKDYEYNVNLLERDKSYEEVTEIFVRVNSLGTKLKTSDLELAQITAKWQGSLSKLDKYQKKLKREGFNIDLGIIVKNLIAFATGSSNSKIVSSLKKEELEKAWDESTKSFNYAINFLRSTMCIDTPALLSSPYILIVLAYLFYHHDYNLSAKNTEKLRYWLLVANTKGHYSRSSIYSFLDKDMKDIRETKDASKTLDIMVDSLRAHFVHLEITKEELDGKNSRNAYFKTMFLAFLNDGAKDWRGSLEISFRHLGTQNKLEVHHIFPKNKLKDKHNTKKINDICNLAFIGATTNKKISDDAPSIYLPKILKKQGEGILKAQQVPTDESLWEINEYDNFLKKRRKMVADRLNEFLKHPKKLSNKKS